MAYILKRYAKFITRFPLLMIISVMVVVIGMAIPLLMNAELPSLHVPRIVARKTDIRGRQLALSLLQKELLSERAICKPFCKSNEFQQDDTSFADRANHAPNDVCESSIVPGRPETVIVFQSINSKDMLSVESIKDMCRAEETLIKSGSALPPIKCGNRTLKSHFSLAYFVARIAGVTKCIDLNNSAVAKARRELYQCRQVYENGLLRKCYERHLTDYFLPKVEKTRLDVEAMKACDQMRTVCPHDGEVYAILNFILDKNFLDNNRSEYAAVHLRQTWGFFMDELTKFYKTGIEKVIADSFGSVEIVATNLGVEFELYLGYLKSTVLLFLVAMAFILVLMIIHLNSVFVTLATCLLIGFAFVTAWFIYRMCLGFTYFSLINSMAGLLLIAIGADDVFVYYDIWVCEKNLNPHGRVEEHVYSTLRHGAASVFVTSFTTAAAFFANTISNISDIRLFGIFSGLGILLNFFLVITFIPPALVLAERLSAKLSCYECSKSTRRRLSNLSKKISAKRDLIFSSLLPEIVSRLWCVWVITFCLLGIGGVVVTFYKPGLQLPSGRVKFYVDEHPFEQYRSAIRDHFKFSSQNIPTLPVQFAWGVHGQDTGKWYEEDITDGYLVYDRSFNFYAKETQVFFKNFCKNLKNSSLIQKNYGKFSRCFFDFVRHILETPCRNAELSSPCCGLTFPFEEKDLKICLPELYSNKTDYFVESVKNHPMIDYPIMHRRKLHDLNYESNDVIAYVYVFPSSIDYHFARFSYYEMEQQYNQIGRFFDAEMEKTHSIGIKNGWFISLFRIYDVQLELNKSTFLSMGISLSVACAVMLLTSLNFFLTLYAMISIGCSIFTTIGVLVFFGWELNVSETIMITIAIGLSIDLPIHYSVAYRLSKGKTSEAKMRSSFKRVGYAVFMASATTFLSGAAIMPTQVMQYRQLGTFLMVVMTTSYLFSTFFFQSLCRIIGPKDRLGNLIDMLAFCLSAKTCIGNESEGSEKATDKHSSITPTEIRNKSSKTPESMARQTRKENYYYKQQSGRSKSGNHRQSERETPVRTPDEILVSWRSEAPNIIVTVRDGKRRVALISEERWKTFGRESINKLVQSHSFTKPQKSDYAIENDSFYTSDEGNSVWTSSYSKYTY